MAESLQYNTISIQPLGNGGGILYSLIETVHDLLGKLDIGSQEDMIILDFSSVFDTIPCRKLFNRWNFMTSMAASTLGYATS